MKRYLSVLTVAFAAMTFAVPAGAEGDIRYETEYNVSLGILPIARASFVTKVLSSGYTISGDVRSAGIVDVIAKISAQTSVSGVLMKDRMQASRYSLVYKSNNKVQTYDVRYRNGDVVKAEIRPTPKRKPRNWIDVTDRDLKSVLDPISGMIVPDGQDVCRRTLPIFDGESRMDLVLSPKGSSRFSVGDVEGEAIVCAIRYVPKSGFRKGRKDIEYLRQATDMEIWFAKTALLKVYAPVYARVPTRMGPLYIRAVRFDG